MNLEDCGEKCVSLIKNASWFPFKSGNLKFNATSGQMVDSQTYRIHFDGTIAPYLEALENGSEPHMIYPKFAKALKFTINGETFYRRAVRHPGSSIHKGFISNKSVKAIIDYICQEYNGVLR